MGTYINDGVFVFEERQWWELEGASSRTLIRKRSHGRLKTYTSLTDVRGVSLNPKERQKYNLRVVNSTRTTFGNYVPVRQLIRIMGVPEQGVLLRQTLEKLALIDEIVNGQGECDFTESEEDMARACFKDEGADPTVVRNLRCLVTNLMEQYCHYQHVKSDRDRLRSRLKEESEALGSQLDSVTQERNCLRDRLARFEDLEERVRKLKEAIDDKKSAEPRMKQIWDSERMACGWELDELEVRANEADCLRQETIELKLRVKELEELEDERDCVMSEMEELKCIVADQDDEIKYLLDQTEQLSSSMDLKQAELKERLTQMDDCLNQKIEEALNSKAMSTECVQLIDSLEMIRLQIRYFVAELLSDKEYSTGDPALHQCEIERLERLGCYLSSRSGCDPKASCSDVEAMVCCMKEALDCQVKELEDLEEQNQCLTEELQETYRCYDESLEMIDQLTESNLCLENQNRRLEEELVEMSEENFSDCGYLKIENDMLKRDLKEKTAQVNEAKQLKQQNILMQCEMSFLKQKLEEKSASGDLPKQTPPPKSPDKPC